MAFSSTYVCLMLSVRIFRVFSFLRRVVSCVFVSAAFLLSRVFLRTWTHEIVILYVQVEGHGS